MYTTLCQTNGAVVPTSNHAKYFGKWVWVDSSVNLYENHTRGHYKVTTQRLDSTFSIPHI